MSLNQLAITAGIMVVQSHLFVDIHLCDGVLRWPSLSLSAQISFLVDLVCERFLVGWRVALALQSVFGSILLVGMIFLPETPRYRKPLVCHKYLRKKINLWRILPDM